MRGKIGALMATVAAAVGAVGAAKWAKDRKEGSDVELEAADAVEPTTPSPAPASPTAADAPAAVEVGASTDATYEGADDLTVIKGLGKVKAAKLAETGITTFAQVAAWSDDDIADVGLKVNTSPGQIKREDWVGQAKAQLEG